MEDQTEDQVVGLTAGSTTEVSSTGADVKYAGFWIRFFARILDAIVLGISITVILLLTYGMVSEGKMVVVFGQEVDWLESVLNAILTAIVTIVFWKYRSATPGKMMMGISIIDAETLGAPSSGTLVLRYVSYLVSTITLFIGYIWVAFDKRKQGFHDKIAGTLVIVNPPKEEAEIESA